MRVAFVQTDPVFGRVEENLSAAEELIRCTEADLYVLPELFSSGYLFCSHEEVLELAEPIPQGPTTRRLLDIAREKRGLIVGGLPERHDDRIYNSAVLVDERGVQAVYRKVHLFLEEKKWFSPGDRPFSTVTINGICLGLMICFDWFFPESVRSLALQGVQIICHPANLVLPYCQRAMVTRCLENRVFAVTANRVGCEERGGKRLTFTGGSQITAPNGDVLASAPADRPCVTAVDIDPSAAADKHVTPLNDLFADRRPECYRL
ncbi:MAG: acyltransferase [candidate division KSB1 bacterium]|nr:acyltransferase [candidate division KSB1 bacterium]